MTDAACGSLEGVPQLTAVGDTTATLTMTVSPHEPVLSGHFPGLPILPGVCVVEHVHRCCRVAITELRHHGALSAIETARFLSPITPGEILTVTLEWTTDADAWQCDAHLATPYGPVARVRLRYRKGGPSDQP